MNMRTFRAILLLSFLSILACKEEKYVYDVEPISLELGVSEKDKEKTTHQYLNILYSNLFQTALSPRRLVQLNDMVESIGDKQIAYEVVVSKLINDTAIVLPPDTLMHNQPEKFITETYKRFYIRLPNQAEIAYYMGFIAAQPNLTVAEVYYAFATSDEYYYY